MDTAVIEKQIQLLMQNPQVVLATGAALFLLFGFILIVWVVRVMRRAKQPKPVLDQPAIPPVFSSAIAPRSVTGPSLKELLDIEESLMALRELYQRQLITAQVYVDESMKHTAKL